MSRPLPRLDRVEARHVRVPFRRPFVTAAGVLTFRSSWILRLRDIDGNEGLGEIALEPAASRAKESAIGRVVRQAVTVLGAGGLPSHGALTKLGASGVALWAGIAEALEQLEALRGAPAVAPAGRSSVAANATVQLTDPTAAAETASQAVAAGFSCLKLKVGAETQHDLVERVQAVRTAIGSSVRLRVDVNAGWDLPTAVERLNALAALDIEFVEQPLAPADLAGHVTLRRASPVPIALDESAQSESTVARILDAGAADVLVIKLARVGGPSSVRVIAVRAASAGVPVVISTFFETGIGLYAALRAAAALPLVGGELAHGLATADILAHDLLATPIAVTGGRIDVPNRLAPDEQAIEHFTVEMVGPMA